MTRSTSVNARGSAPAEDEPCNASNRALYWIAGFGKTDSNIGMDKAVVFFYGSLKRGHANHHRIADQQFLGTALTEPRYRIVQIGQYGGLVRNDAHGLAVSGELWAIDDRCLSKLDAFEQAEGLWMRRPVAIQGYEGVESYVWTGAVPEGVRSAAEWPFPRSGRGSDDTFAPE